ncbi:hypothetical protein CWI75_07715 [Kineobactrum sediminis]|uniref:Alpha/beta hydrolase domain-containing protein n=1 Tax=Kineobactrum sediminis TaxID=1905677 RepID=A0A2N5Y4I0_9GAMM|nr:alpha/beta hydrolase domain-containing protein [Kineobactrum sediminis]PLW83282.1 hypothetical protein CWI75_07715 [Kineobactrum sediminis]
MKDNKIRLTLALGLTAVLLAACSDSNDSPATPVEPTFLAIAQPLVEDPPEVGQPSLLATTFDLADVGYEQREFFLSGDASAFTNLSELGVDGAWEVEAGETAPYRTRVIIYRPIDPADFSGTVMMEWLNVTAGFETPPSYGSGHVEILRSGHVWVGVSAQLIGIEGSDRGLLPLHLKAANPERYESLAHPGDSFSYDIFSQAAQALREPETTDLLPGLAVERLIALGESQSAGRLVSYINAIQPLYNPFDGYMVHSRGGSSSALAQEPLTAIPTPDGVRIRTDINVPVLNFQTETDLLVLGSVSSRQDDNDRFRLWETTGSAHGDYYSFVSGRADTGEDPQFAVVVEVDSIFGFINCDQPMNAGSMPWIFNAALRSLDTWVRDGTAPPEAPRLDLNDSMTAFIKDELGNVTGGIRTPYVDSAAAILSGENQSGRESFCFLFGSTALFDATQMAQLYVDQAGYEAAVSEAADDAVAKGFLLAEDAERIKAAATLQWQALGT